MDTYGTCMRKIGMLVTDAGCLLFIASAFTAYWVESGTRHYGLWSLCKNQDHEEEEDEDIEEKDDDDEDIEEEEDCKGFGLRDIPAEFHVVRLFVVFAIPIIVYSLTLGRYMRCTKRSTKSFLHFYKIELICLLGASAGQIAVIIFKLSFKSFDFNYHDKPELDWSEALAQYGCIFMFLGIFITILPTVGMKCRSNLCNGPLECCPVSCDDFRSEPCGAFCYCVLCVPWESRESFQRNAEPEEDGSHNNSPPSLNDSFVPENAAGSDPETDPVIFTGGTRNSPLPSRRSPSLVIPLNPDSSYTEPAPRYEDLSPRVIEDVPPPPSYGEVISGLYSTTDTSATASASTNISPLPSAPELMPDHYEPPPPGYDETTA